MSAFAIPNTKRYSIRAMAVFFAFICKVVERLVVEAVEAEHQNVFLSFSLGSKLNH